METEQLMEIAIDFAFLISIWVVVSPLLISLLKNVGGEWPQWLKQATAVVMAAIGSVLAYAGAAQLGDVNLADWANLKPLIVGSIGAFAAQFAVYAAIWKGTPIETAAASFTPGNTSTGV